MTTLDTLEIETGPQPTASVIVMHGLGDSAEGFAPVIDALDLAGLPPLRFVLPNAPTRPVTMNAGYVMRAWYDILGPGRPEDEAGLRAAQALVEGLLARERERGIAPSRTVLMGFSQGCAMTLMTGLRHAEPLAALVGLSGYLPLAATTAAERHAANAATPLFLAHGDQDEVITLARARHSHEALLALGQPVEWHVYPMAHSVCAPELADLTAFLRRVLA